MRDENDYHGMDRLELRSHLERVAKELAVWTHALGRARRDHNYYYVDGYANSRAKAVTERKMEAEIAAAEFQREIFDNEAQVAYWTTIRDLIVELLR